jgi:acetyl-CoA synthetase
VLIDGNGDEPADTRDFGRLLAAAPPSFEIPPTDPQDPALLHFTSGTTGTPKGAVHVHEAVVVHQATARRALGLEPGTVYWCTADPGWVTGISYGLVAPLVAGATAVVDTQEFEADRWYAILSAQAVEVWYTAPTAIRLLERQGPAAAKRFRFSSLRHLASVGEPLEREAVEWGREVFGTPFHDTWWQTETGGIMIGNFPGAEVRPGSMGKPFPGVRAAVVERRGTEVAIVDQPDEVGQLALATPWPSMFREYRGEPERYRQCFAGGWYLTGDLVRRDRDGYYWFVGRVDDAIQSAGHLIGPFEVEAVMMEHPAVVDAAAIGKPDPVAFETVAVCVVLREENEATPELERELLAHARRRLGPAVAPRSIYYRPSLPHTPSGKILRRQLRDEITRQHT